MSDEAGVWMTFSWDMGASDVRPYPSEIEALRAVNGRGYGRAIFVPFGATCDEAEKAERDEASRRPRGEIGEAS